MTDVPFDETLADEAKLCDLLGIDGPTFADVAFEDITGASTERLESLSVADKLGLARLDHPDLPLFDGWLVPDRTGVGFTGVLYRLDAVYVAGVVAGSRQYGKISVLPSDVLARDRPHVDTPLSQRFYTLLYAGSDVSCARVFGLCQIYFPLTKPVDNPLGSMALGSFLEGVASRSSSFLPRRGRRFVSLLPADVDIKKVASLYERAERAIRKA